MYQAKKLVLVSATSLLVTETSKEDYVSLERVFCIHYLFCFYKNTIGIKALIDPGNEVNTMTLAYRPKLGLKIYLTNIGA